MSKMDQLLSAVFYRRSCPAVETLGDYALGTLPRAERLAVALHLRDCPLCTRELAEYAADTRLPSVKLAGLLDSLAEGLGSLVGRVTWGELVLTVPGARRGRGDMAVLQTYRDGEMEVVLSLLPPVEKYGLPRLLGRIEPPAAVTAVDLWRGAEPIATRAVDEDGYFEFADLEEAAYTLCLHRAGAEVWLEVKRLA